MVFEKLEQRIIVRGLIELKTPLHIGSAKSDIDIGEVELPILKDVQDQPYIPGSSIKGRVRSEAERIARTENMPHCSPPDTRNMCGTISPDKLCICCSIFGTAGDRISVASKVRFRDAYPTEKVPETMIRAGIAMDRSTGSASRAKLYTIEAVPAETKFRFEIVGENLAPQEMKMLKAALSSATDTALGGSTSRGMGKIDLILESATVKTSKVYLGEEKEQRFDGQEFQKWWAKF
jgi:CRISPR type III-A-associated RAMP protein Csm3